jgi:hypothetical protein
MAGVRNTDPGEQPDDFLATCSLHAIWTAVFFAKVLVGVLSIPLLALVWLHELGSRMIDAVNAFMNPNHDE